MTRFIKTTILGGILFIVPIVIFIALVGKALELTNIIAIPLAERFAVDLAGDVVVVHLLALAILIFICFAAGLAAKTTIAGKFVKS